MSPSALLANASDVTRDFSNEVALTITSGWHLILLYLFPVFVTFLFLRKPKHSKKLRVGTAQFDKWFFSVIISAICAAAFFLLGNYYGQFEPSFSSEYQFDASMRKNGVLATLIAEIEHETSSGNLIISENAFDDSDGMTDETGDSAGLAEDETKDSVKSDEEISADAEDVIVYEPNTMDIDFEALAATADSDAVANLDRYLASQSGTMKNKYTGLFEGKNLILITAEAFSHFAVDETLTPTLYRMMHNGFYFSDYYQPAWRATEM